MLIKFEIDYYNNRNNKKGFISKIENLPIYNKLFKLNIFNEEEISKFIKNRFDLKNCIIEKLIIDLI